MSDLGHSSRCDDCFRRTYGRKCTRRECPGYVGVWLGDQQRVLRKGLEAYDGLSTMVTITARGSDVFPWDRAWCKHDPGEKCSGSKGCRVVHDQAVEWNATAQARGRKLLNAGRQYASRRHGRDLPEVLAVVQQDQKRGLTHLHVAVGYRPGQRDALSAFFDGLKRNARRHGFGKVDLGRPGRWTEGALGGYMGRYLSPGRYGESFLALMRSVSARNRERQAIGEPRRVLRPVWVSSSLQRKAMVSMGFERWNRQAWWWWAGKGTRLDRQKVYMVESVFRERKEPWEVPRAAVGDADAEPASTEARWSQLELGYV